MSVLRGSIGAAAANLSFDQPVRCGVSTVAGYGLFAQKDIRKNALISGESDAIHVLRSELMEVDCFSQSISVRR